ncbi:polyprotein [Operophtera brumata]|uniref:Polyprotein n=1 Tax=Operophtera brumata TaxID=104452 RepID=A0A0L7KZM8_OPEBR|nr:polyprotein [Operophtera brumata]
MWRLRKCLRGAAKEAVSALLVSASSPEIIISTLKLRFGNPEYILSKLVYDIKKLPPMSQDYHKEIVSFSVKIQNFTGAVRAVGREEYLQGMSVVSVILSKLPTVLLSRWTDYSFIPITEGKESRLVLLSDFLKEEAVKVSTTSNTLLCTYAQRST